MALLRGAATQRWLLFERADGAGALDAQDEALHHAIEVIETIVAHVGCGQVLGDDRAAAAVRSKSNLQ